MSTLVKRIISALVLGTITIVEMYLGGWWFYAFMIVIFAISFYEWSRLSHVIPSDSEESRADKRDPSRFALRMTNYNLPLLSFGILYIGLGCWCAVLLREQTLEPLLYPIFAIWACDIGAYAAGKTIGGPKMAPTISPNKTWAGLVGGCIAAGGALVLFSLYLQDIKLQPLTLPIHFALGVFLGVIGQIGDVFVSLLKRRCGLKDTGKIIPGHGGLLDRIDSLLLALPVFSLIYFLVLSV